MLGLIGELVTRLIDQSRHLTQTTQHTAFESKLNLSTIVILFYMFPHIYFFHRVCLIVCTVEMASNNTHETDAEFARQLQEQLESGQSSKKSNLTHVKTKKRKSPTPEENCNDENEPYSLAPRRGGHNKETNNDVGLHVSLNLHTPPRETKQERKNRLQTICRTWGEKVVQLRRNHQ